MFSEILEVVQFNLRLVIKYSIHKLTCFVFFQTLHLLRFNIWCFLTQNCVNLLEELWLNDASTAFHIIDRSFRTIMKENNKSDLEVLKLHYVLETENYNC